MLIKSDSTKLKLAEVYRSLLGAVLLGKDKVENQSFRAVKVKNNAYIEAKRDIIAYENGIFGWGIY